MELCAVCLEGGICQRHWFPFVTLLRLRPTVCDATKLQMIFCEGLSVVWQIQKALVTYSEQSDVVADEIADHVSFLWGLSARLEQAGGKDGGQILTGHVVEMGTLLNPEPREEETCLEWITKKHQHFMSSGVSPSHHTHTLNEMLDLSSHPVKVQIYDQPESLS